MIIENRNLIKYLKELLTRLHDVELLETNQTAVKVLGRIMNDIKQTIEHLEGG